MTHLYGFQGVDWLADTIKAALVDTTDAPSVSDRFWSDLSGSEVSGTGYTAGGEELTGKTLAFDESAQTVVASAATLTFSTVTLTDVGYLVVYKDSGDPATSVIVHTEDLRDTSGGPPVGRDVTSDDIVVQFSAQGIEREEVLS